MKLTVNRKIVEAKEGENLSDVLVRNGFSHPRPCGGKGVCGKCAVLVNGKRELACRYTLTESVTVEVAVEGEIHSEIGGKASVSSSASPSGDLALDLGTTTVALAVLSKEGEPLSVTTFNNPQRRFGADVVSRMEFASKSGAEPMTQAICREISEKIAELSSAFGIPVFYRLHVAGNATMLHLLVGENPASMGVAPYTSVFWEEKWLSAAEFGIFGVKELHLLPSVSAFVGADLVAGLNLVDLPAEGKYRLLVDLGTNAEVLLFSKDKILCTAAAAGPCFEGANLSHGMSATQGALSSYGEEGFTTIGNVLPVGICGTGLVDVVATLLKRGEIDESGYMEEDVTLFPGVVFTKGDVRQYQLAKSAVYSAIVTLLKRMGAGFEDVEALYVAGGFAAKLNVENALLTGLLPKELKRKFVYVGNSSLLGTVKAAKEGGDLSRFTEKAEYVDLSKDAFFTETFISNMLF